MQRSGKQGNNAIYQLFLLTDKLLLLAFNLFSR